MAERALWRSSVTRSNYWRRPTNRKPNEADHDSRDIQSLIDEFDAEREKLMSVLRKVTDNDLHQSAVHPRLGTPMKLIDLAFFVAEHDDHHLAQITFLST
ncbi:MAG: DinB family protein [Lewinellaceae bacterium]|nr:DinB family protein [Lewinellaceae bacterium]